MLTPPPAGRIARAICLLALLLPVLAFASDRVPKPIIDIDKPGRCVEDTATMRREHPDMLKHQRDLTMHAGIRTRKHSLKECVECHASAKTGSAPDVVVRLVAERLAKTFGQPFLIDNRPGGEQTIGASLTAKAAPDAAAAVGAPEAAHDDAAKASVPA